MGKIVKYQNNEFYLFEYKSIYFIYNVDTLTFCVLSHEEYQKVCDNEGFPIIDSFLAQDMHILKDKPKLQAETEYKPLKVVALEVSNDCNLRCSYCYGDGGTYGKEACYMSSEVAYNCIDFLINHSMGVKNLQVIFFGGEPLMNFNVIYEVVEYTKTKTKELGIHFSYGITTNATLLDEKKINYLKENKFVITVSIDGPKEVHDMNRYYKLGVGSHDRTVEAVKQMLQKGMRLRARATINRAELRLTYIDKYLADLGFEDVVLTYVDIDSSDKLYIPDEKFEIIEKEIEALGEICITELLSTKSTHVHMFKASLERLYTHYRAERACGSGVTYAAFTAKGELYPCHRFSNWDKYKLGDFNSENFGNKEFLQCTVLNRETCNECFGRHICGGNCIHSAALFNGSIYKTDSHYCKLYNKVFEIAMYIYNTISERNPELFNEIFNRQGKQ